MCTCDLDASPAEFSERRFPRAAKPYRCEECGGIIAPGTVHEYMRGRWEGSFLTFRTCLQCCAARDLLECFTYGDLTENLRDCADEYPAHDSGGKRFALGRALVGMRRRRGKPVPPLAAAREVRAL